MFKKEEAAKIRQAFWTAFGHFIAPHPSAEGIKVNWINYKTGLKYVHFKLNADGKKASVSIELSHPDIEIQELFYEQFLELKMLLHTILNEEWEWNLHIPDEMGKIISNIKKEISPVNIYKQEEWPELISFLKPRIIALDEFWTDAKYSFESLR
jgi:hypothetical protein